jgi:hypothetical protein
MTQKCATLKNPQKSLKIHHEHSTKITQKNIQQKPTQNAPKRLGKIQQTPQTFALSKTRHQEMLSQTTKRGTLRPLFLFLRQSK